MDEVYDDMQMKLASSQIHGRNYKSQLFNVICATLWFNAITAYALLHFQFVYEVCS